MIASFPRVLDASSSAAAGMLSTSGGRERRPRSGSHSVPSTSRQRPSRKPPLTCPQASLAISQSPGISPAARKAGKVGTGLAPQGLGTSAVGPDSSAMVEVLPEASCDNQKGLQTLSKGQNHLQERTPG